MLQLVLSANLAADVTVSLERGPLSLSAVKGGGI